MRCAGRVHPEDDAVCVLAAPGYREAVDRLKRHPVIQDMAGQVYAGSPRPNLRNWEVVHAAFRAFRARSPRDPGVHHIGAPAEAIEELVAETGGGHDNGD